MDYLVRENELLDERLWHVYSFLKIILKTSSSPTSNTTSTTLPQGQILQTADGQFIILQSTEQHQTQQPQYVQVGGQSKIEE